MTGSSRNDLGALWRRVKEVRGLSPDSGTADVGALDDPEALVQVLGQVVDDLEQSHRRLIETQVQLASLREVASTLAGTRDAAEATRLVARYLRDVLEFEQAGLLLVDRAGGRLKGTWGWSGGLTPVEAPLATSGVALVESLWTERTLEHHDPARHPALVLPEGHPLAELFAGHSSFVCVALQPVGASRTAPERRGCDECATAEATTLAPPPGADAASWRATREDARRRCLACERMPMLGVLVAARGAGAVAPSSERSRLEAVAFSLAPMVENARLVHELARSQRFLADVVDSMPSALVAFDPDGLVLSLNRTAQELLGLDEAAASGRDVGELFGEEGEAYVRRTLGSGQAVVRRETMLRPPGRSPLPARLTTSQLTDAQGRAYGAIATFLDLTPLRAAEERARQLDQLAALGRFTSSVAHEIRNPLTGIGMGVRRLSKALREQPAEVENVEFVLSEIRRLDGIVQELFDITHPRKLDLTARPVEETMRRAEQSVAAVLAEREVRVERGTVHPLPPVPHDADQMQQVFINLLKNAAEASPAGSVIRVSFAAPAPGSHSVTVTVTDAGCGMDEDTQRTLFEPFFTTKPKGTGLGLYVTHEIVKRHGGSLGVTSAPGAGATFSVELPMDPYGGVR
jgi:PAS domain S-box-containing protein